MPPKRRVIELSPSETTWKSLAWVAGSMPVSRTLKRRGAAGGGGAHQRNGDSGATLFGKLDRVAGEVEQNLLQARGVAQNVGGQIGRERERKFEPLCHGAGVEKGGDVRDSLRQGKGDGLEVQIAAFDFREIEDVVQQPHEGVGGTGSNFDLALLGGIQRRVFEDLQPALDAVHRRADFVCSWSRENRALPGWRPRPGLFLAEREDLVLRCRKSTATAAGGRQSGAWRF